MGDKVKVIHNYDGITVPKIKDSVESFLTLAREEKCKVKHPESFHKYFKTKLTPYIKTT